MAQQSQYWEYIQKYFQSYFTKVQKISPSKFAISSYYLNKNETFKVTIQLNM